MDVYGVNHDKTHQVFDGDGQEIVGCVFASTKDGRIARLKGAGGPSFTCEPGRGITGPFMNPEWEEGFCKKPITVRPFGRVTTLPEGWGPSFHQRVWVAGRNPPSGEDRRPWELLGIYTTREKAIASCSTVDDFVASLLTDMAPPNGTVDFPDAFYPMMEAKA